MMLFIHVYRVPTPCSFRLVFPSSAFLHADVALRTRFLTQATRSGPGGSSKSQVDAKQVAGAGEGGGPGLHVMISLRGGPPIPMREVDQPTTQASADQYRRAVDEGSGSNVLQRFPCAASTGTAASALVETSNARGDDAPTLAYSVTARHWLALTPSLVEASTVTSPLPCYARSRDRWRARLRVR